MKNHFYFKEEMIEEWYRKTFPDGFRDIEETIELSNFLDSISDVELSLSDIEFCINLFSVYYVEEYCMRSLLVNEKRVLDFIYSLEKRSVFEIGVCLDFINQSIYYTEDYNRNYIFLLKNVPLNLIEKIYDSTFSSFYILCCLCQGIEITRKRDFITDFQTERLLKKIKKWLSYREYTYSLEILMKLPIFAKFVRKERDNFVIASRKKRIPKKSYSHFVWKKIILPSL